MLQHPELSSATPRAVESSFLHLADLIILSVVFAFICTLANWRIVPDVIQQKNLRDRGVEKTAVISDLHPENHKHHHATYRFNVDGTSYTGDSIVSDEEYRALFVGSTIPIVYDSGKIEISQYNIANYTLSGESYEKYLTISILINSVIIGAYIALLFYILRNKDFEKHLLMWGATAAARITHETEYEIKNGKRTKISYEFSVPGQGTFTGTRDDVPPNDCTLSFETASRSALIENPIVLYQPSDPRKNALYPMVEAKLQQ